MKTRLSALGTQRRAALALACLVAWAAPTALRAGGAAPVEGATPAPLSQRPASTAAPEAGGLLKLGADLTAQGDYATAEIAYRQVLERRDFSSSDQRAALFGLAHMFRKAGSYTKAAAIYEKFIKQFPDDYRVPDAFLDLGRTLRTMGAYDLALTRFYSVINTTLKVGSQSFDHYMLLAKTAQFEIAQTHFEAGNYAEAARYFSKVRRLELAPADQARAQFMAACSQQRAGDLEGAVSTLQDFLKEWPDDSNTSEAQYLLAMTLDTLKRPQEALAVTLNLLASEHGRSQIDPKAWSYWQRRTGNRLANSFFLEGDFANALKIYNGLLDLAPEPAWRTPVAYQIALCYERLNQWDAARDAYRKVVETASVKPGAPAVSQEVSDLAQMAAWRMGHLQWRDDYARQLKGVMPSSERPSTASPVSPKDPSGRQPAS